MSAPSPSSPGKFTYRLVRGELEFPDYGTVEAHCRVDRGRVARRAPHPAAAGLGTGPDAVRRRALRAPGGRPCRRRGRRASCSSGSAPTPDLAALFVTAPHTGALEDVAAAVRELLDPRVLIGATAVSVVGGAREVEETPGLSLWAGRLPGRVTAVRLSAHETADGWAVDGLDPRPGGRGDDPAAASPTRSRSPSAASWPRSPSAHPHLAVIGGLASAARGPGGNRLVLDGTLVRRRRRRRAARRRRQPGDGGVAGLPADRPAVHRDPRRAQRALRAGRPAGPRAAPRDGGGSSRPTTAPWPPGACTAASSSTSASSSSAGATSWSATCSAPTVTPAPWPSATRCRSGRRCSSRSATRRRPTRTSATCWPAEQADRRAGVHLQRPRHPPVRRRPNHDAERRERRCSARRPSPACSAPASWARSAAATTCTASPPRSPCSATEVAGRAPAPVRDRAGSRQRSAGRPHMRRGRPPPGGPIRTPPPNLSGGPTIAGRATVRRSRTSSDPPTHPGVTSNLSARAAHG